MGLLLRRYQPTANLLTGAMTPSPALAGWTTTATEPDDAVEPLPEGDGRSMLVRAARVLLWTVLGLLVVREATEGLQTLGMRSRRAMSRWWSDVDRRSRSETRRAEIGLLASWIGHRRR